MKKYKVFASMIVLYMAAHFPVAGQLTAQRFSLPAFDSTKILPGSSGKSDSLKTASPTASTPALSHADSLTKIAERDSLTAEKLKHFGDFKKFPVSIDSLYNPTRLYQPYLFASDAVGLSEVMGPFQQVVSAPFSLSSGLNRFMIYGFPLPPVSLYSGDNMLGENPTSLSGTDRITCTQLSSVFVESPLRLRYDPYPLNQVTPETDVFWEHGVFSENIFTVRVSRPLSDKLNVGIFFNNRHFDPLTYGVSGDINTFYSSFVTDSTMLSQGGKYPLVDEQNSSIRLTYDGKNGIRSHLSLSYNDQRNEESFEKDSGGKSSLQWDRIFQYGTIANAGISGMRIRPLILNVESQIITEGNSLYDPIQNSELTGRNNEYSLAVKPFVPFFSDTLSAMGIFKRHDQTRYDNSNPSALSIDGSLAFAHHFRPFDQASALVSGSIGEHYEKITAGGHDHDWTWNINADIQAHGALLRFYSTRDFAPFPVLYDSTAKPFNVYFDPYIMHGVELFAWYDKIGVTTGVCALTGLDGADSSEFWPRNVLPYQQPRISYMVAPLFGQWHGFSAASRWMFADKKPYVKARTSLSYQAHPLNWNEHILLDLAYDYWSSRDMIAYGGDNTWSREIDNLSLKTAVQIKTFSLFYKVDNILDRSFAYVPGYRMPGITFRWGFQWLIPG
jgi:hypothetical protein